MAAIRGTIQTSGNPHAAFAASRSAGAHPAVGSKLPEARMVSTTTAAKANSPGPGSTMASSPSLTSATRIASTNTSSMAHGPTRSMAR